MVKRAFSQRRKMMRKNLEAAGLNQLDAAFAAVDLDSKFGRKVTLEQLWPYEGVMMFNYRDYILSTLSMSLW